jgi:hypothetical protein
MAPVSANIAWIGEKFDNVTIYGNTEIVTPSNNGLWLSQHAI